ncbi:helix-turn-helix transcriptional regulator [Limnobaculum xujianqingii]|uniref:helix-turn-helix transcriptional regulator n=1 Tax=Limnobaculum xujianqingii TaxID=2738837 RepID=UPI00112BB310|nr:helix-turn-helix transcriptional regulator [Limnobaculum xujianqingii]
MINIRLKEERERLGLTQPQLAEVANASKRTVIEWEKGATSPSAVQLSALSFVGVDVQYVLTGKRMTRAEAKRLGIFKPDAYIAQAIASIDGDESYDEEPFTMNTPATYRLSKDEWELMQRFRAGSLETKMEVMKILMSVDMPGKTTDDYKPESNENKSSGINVSGNSNRVAGRNYNERKK